jgi:MerR family transcriptional regulator, light-induced transcriptional regulator
MKMQEFSIKELESFTGIKAHTIRIWEQRYGLLAPDRTDTNIRKYTDRDLKLLLNVSLLNNLGYKISLIAQMSEEEMREAIVKCNASDNQDQQFMHILKLAMLNYDEVLFNGIVDAHIEEHGLKKTFTEMFLPFLKQIGYLWLANAICPAQEHFISCLVRQKMYSLIDNLKVETDLSLKPVVLFLPELEIHELSLIMTHYVIKEKGRKSIMLGQSVPLEDLQQIYHRLGDVHFVSIFTTHPAHVLVGDYLKKIARLFQGTECHFHLTGNNLQGIKSPDTDYISIYQNMEHLVNQF